MRINLGLEIRYLIQGWRAAHAPGARRANIPPTWKVQTVQQQLARGTVCKMDQKISPEIKGSIISDDSYGVAKETHMA